MSKRIKIEDQVADAQQVISNDLNNFNVQVQTKKQKIYEPKKFFCSKCSKETTCDFFLYVEEQKMYCNECLKLVYVKNSANTHITYIQEEKIKLGDTYCIWCNRKVQYGSYCGKHKASIIPLNSTHVHKCLECENKALYTDIIGSDPKHCTQHKLDNEINVSKSVCIASLCLKSAYYGPSRDNLIHCYKHKTQEDIYTPFTMCKKCSTVATFGHIIDGKKISLYCATHKDPEHIITIGTKYCICGAIAKFRLNSNSFIYCLQCAFKNGLVTHLIKPDCKFCNKKAVYGPENGSAEFCRRHHTSMVKEGFITDYVKIK